jgi:hypothetical protein
MQATDAHRSLTGSPRKPYIPATLANALELPSDLEVDFRLFAALAG